MQHLLASALWLYDCQSIKGASRLLRLILGQNHYLLKIINERYPAFSDLLASLISSNYAGGCTEDADNVNCEEKNENLNLFSAGLSDNFSPLNELLQQLEKLASKFPYYEEKARPLSAAGIQATFLGSTTYPKCFLGIEPLPLTLFYHGNLFALINSKNFKIGIVGTRHPTGYGISVTKDVANIAAHYNCPIISGMAMGVDSLAHTQALLHHTPTLAVLANGIDICYPRQNRPIYEAIWRSQVLVSEYPPGTVPLRYYFPVRNRLLAAFSDILVVTEAGAKSGSLITAGYAAEIGKSVWTVPGTIYSKQSSGSNRLLNDGAIPLIAPENLADEIERQTGTDLPLSAYKEKPPELSPLSEKILRELTVAERSVDELCVLLHCKLTELLPELSICELKGLIFSRLGRYAVKDSAYRLIN